MINSKSISFVWASLSKYCLFDARHTIISGTRVYSVCLFADGEVPETCVSGSGVYRCVSTDDRGEHVFELQLTYLEVDKVGDTFLVKGIIDVSNSKPHLPLGLLA